MKCNKLLGPKQVPLLFMGSISMCESYRPGHMPILSYWVPLSFWIVDISMYMPRVEDAWRLFAHRLFDDMAQTQCDLLNCIK